MEKRRITIICAIIYLLIVYALGKGLYAGYRGFTESSNDVTEEPTEHMLTIRVELEPNIKYPDKINNIGGSQIINYKTKAVEAVLAAPQWHMIVTGLLVIPVAGLLIYAIICFAIFIHNIKKGRIFIKKNVKRMRFIAISFLICFFYMNFNLYRDYLIAQSQFQLDNYEVVHPSYRFSFLWVFLVFTLFAEVFSLGIRMKEEQELTI